MPIIFEKSAISQAFEKTVHLFVAVIVGVVFGSPFFMKIDLDMMWKIILGVAVIISILMSMKLTREIIETIKSGEAWRVTITDEELSWYSPIPDQMESFVIQLSDIKAVHRFFTRYRNSKRSPKVEFKIEFTNGEMLELKSQMCGINPQKVFKTLEEKNILFEVHTLTEGPKFKVGNGDISIGVDGKNS